MSPQMQGLRFDRYGPPVDVLRLREVAAPEPAAGEVVIRVRAASVNPVEWHLVRGEPFLMRLMNGVRRPRVGDVGFDAAGVVESVGAGVTDLEPGDEVFGHANGSFAELARAKAARLAPKPAGVSFEQAASLPVAGGTALHAIVTHGRLEPGQRVLVIGAGGGVGSFAVQLAKAIGAHVTGVCGTAKVDFVRALGADRVVDYTREDVAQQPERYDLVVQLAGDHSISALRRIVTPAGRLVLAGSGAGRDGAGILRGAIVGLVASRVLTRFTRQTVKMFISSTSRPQLETLARYVESGEIVPAIERTYPLAEAGRALAELESGHTRGKLVLTI